MGQDSLVGVMGLVPVHEGNQSGGTDRIGAAYGVADLLTPRVAGVSRYARPFKRYEYGAVRPEWTLRALAHAAESPAGA